MKINSMWMVLVAALAFVTGGCVLDPGNADQSAATGGAAGTGGSGGCGGTAGQGGSNNCGPTCCPNTTVSITCPNSTSGTATCNANGTAWSYQCGGTGGSGGGCNGSCGGSGGTGGSSSGSCTGNGVSHDLLVKCVATNPLAPKIDLKGGRVAYQDHNADKQAQWCDAWYDSAICSTTNGDLECHMAVQGKTSPRFQTYLRYPSADADDGNTPHGFSSANQIQLLPEWTCQAFVDGVAVTDTKGQPLSCQSTGCAVDAPNITGDAKWPNLTVDVY